MILTKEWARAALIRSVRTFAQTFASLMTVGAAIHEINWGYIASVSAVALIYSIMTSLAGLPEVDGDTPKELYIDDTAPAEIEHGDEEKG